jgi:hypothetical protein
LSKFSGPKWYDEAAMTDGQAMQMTKMKEECLDTAVTPMTGEQFPFPAGMMAHAYVPWQCYEQAFSPRDALMRGTLFPELWGAYPIPK